MTASLGGVPAIPVMIYPVPVQGAEAAPEIARMLDVASDRGECDVLILARGGGSLEDLWAFNEESVARAIRRCSMPVVTGAESWAGAAIRKGHRAG